MRNISLVYTCPSYSTDFRPCVLLAGPLQREGGDLTSVLRSENTAGRSLSLLHRRLWSLLAHWCHWRKEDFCPSCSTDLMPCVLLAGPLQREGGDLTSLCSEVSYKNLISIQKYLWQLDFLVCSGQSLLLSHKMAVKSGLPTTKSCDCPLPQW